MHGDFSRNGFDQQANIDGVLHQQGRVLTDADWNEQTLIGDRWQRAAARAAIGGGFAAVGSGDPDALLVVQGPSPTARSPSTSTPGRCGRAGARSPALVDRQRLRAGAPAGDLPDAPPGPAPGAPGTRDAVVLELWREALSGFQVPHRLIEPALGGVDTTERIWHGLAFRLLRLGAGEGCDEIGDQLEDDRSTRRRLSASLVPTQSPTATAPWSRAAATAGSSTTSTASRSQT